MKGTNARPGSTALRSWGASGLVVAALIGTGTDPGGPWWATEALSPGPAPVGLNVRILTDSSRPDAAGHPRRVQLTVWYPAQGGGRPVTFADYVRLTAAETTDVETATAGDSAVVSYRRFLASASVPDSTIDRWFALPMLAVRGLARAPGSFPLVLLAQGNGQSAMDQSVLGEYLASQGYIVATSPSQARLTGKPDDEASVGAAAGDQAADLALLLGAVRREGEQAVGPVAVIGHSFGARSALLLLLRDSTIRCLVSLDGGIGTATARVSFEGVRAFRPGSAHGAILHFYEELDPPMRPDWGTLSKLNGAEVWVAKTTALHHHHFTTLGAASGTFPALGKATGATEETAAQYSAVLGFTRAFLAAALRGDSAALQRIQRDPAGLHAERLPIAPR